MSVPAPELASPLNPPLPAAKGEALRWGRLSGSAKALALAAAAGNADGPLIVATPDPLSAQRLIEELIFFTPASAPQDCLPRLFPDWETLPYDRFSPLQDIVSERLAALVDLPDLGRGVLVAPVATLMHRLLPRDFLLSHSLSLRRRQTLPEAFRERLVERGYRVVSQVAEPGDLAVRGSLLDLYPMGAAAPCRLDLFDNEIDSIRTFDVETQRSLEEVEAIRILPARETPLTPHAIDAFQDNWRLRFKGNPNRCPVYEDVGQGLAPAGIEYFLPLFYESTDSLFDYAPASAVVALEEGVAAAAQEFWDLAEARHEQGREDDSRPLLAPEELFETPERLFQRLESFPQARLSAASAAGPQGVDFAAQPPPKLPVESRARAPLALFSRFREGFPGRILLVAESLGRRETIRELFQNEKARPVLCQDWEEFAAGDAALALTVAPLERGATLERPALAVVSESQLFGERAQQRRLRKRRQPPADSVVSNLTQLSIGAPVVHEEHGVGRYRGLATLTVDGLKGEFLCLEYDRGDKLYLPVAALELVSRFVGVDPEHAPLHRLGSGQWLKVKRKAMARACDVAAELLELHARRALAGGHPFVVDEDAYSAFVAEFPFEETPGQVEAIDGTLEDMRAPAPMDRLVCGDSGFGKTEVAMRAAFVAALNHKQAVLLAPTTLLAQQHGRNFKDRFADWPVRVETLSRFIPGKAQAEVIAGLKEGVVDIVIGTHKLLRDDIVFKNLGLVIIDEEHRFGVRQKEKLKSLRAEVDVLTLTATPIPRTLNLALSELRALSVIATPPSKRLPVKIFVREWDDALIREAMLREIKRGGQVYFVHNKVETIEKAAKQAARLAPEARVRLAHGQMPEKQLEQVMLDFYHLRFNVLVCTTIIETGIDVPTANTIIIDRADRFGLAQLYQLRGRVGRSRHRAYAYLITPPRSQLNEDARKRLEAIEALEELGTGFTLAVQDLEIRGVGELLGDEQSGTIQQIGFGVYMDLLQRAVSSLRAGRQPRLEGPLARGEAIDLRVPALIPDDYLPDVHGRLIMYKRIAGAADQAALGDLQVECIDRFGMLPEPLKNLFRLAALKQDARALGVGKIELGEKGGRVAFHEGTSVAPEQVLELVLGRPDLYKLGKGGDTLKILQGAPDAEGRFRFVGELLRNLSPEGRA